MYVISLILIFSLLGCGGCASPGSLDQVFALKDYADEKEAQDVWARAQDKRFDDLLEKAEASGALLDRYRDKKSIVSIFGEPAFCRARGAEEQCLYRSMVNPGRSPKIYFYFDAAGYQLRREIVTMDKE
ncbi:MAG: hypothetical protein WCI27_01695 [Candidatus Omnitrophota bacterium]